jgi:hypothetical protein
LSELINFGISDAFNCPSASNCTINSWVA